ncbi:MAG TPA: hypothetical protein VGN64_04185, partial [Dyadobacter sp.]|nr:hypothetical protein [Dyadobacter sp.]
IPNREVKPGTADDTWIKPGKVGSRHNTIKIPSSKEMGFFAFIAVCSTPFGVVEELTMVTSPPGFARGYSCSTLKGCVTNDFPMSSTPCHSDQMILIVQHHQKSVDVPDIYEGSNEEYF